MERRTQRMSARNINKHKIKGMDPIYDSSDTNKSGKKYGNESSEEEDKSFMQKLGGFFFFGCTSNNDDTKKP